jgi:hypothetical protein
MDCACWEPLVLVLQALEPGLRAWRLRFDRQHLDPLHQVWQTAVQPRLPADIWAGGRYLSTTLDPEPADWSLVSYDTWPLFWCSAHSRHSWQWFAHFFKALALKTQLRPWLDFRRQPVMYAGFFVVGNRAEETMWHCDYRPNAQALTLITPLTTLAPGHGHLLWQSATGHIQRYTYQPGEALLFGPGFLHSTEPYAPGAELRVLLSLTLGSDRHEHWPLIAENIAEQSTFYARPCGHFSPDSCRCGQPFWRRF